jgi:hypothetical protein
VVFQGFAFTGQAYNLAAESHKIVRDREEHEGAAEAKRHVPGSIDPLVAPSLANYETNVFYWPVKAQLT